LHKTETINCKAFQGEAIVSDASFWITQQMEVSARPQAEKQRDKTSFIIKYS
jgi:hypothetical protein